ncbi:mycothiol synthase [Rhodococcus erythropolis]|uniref:Mycothiol acetyltransferase n=1 Tax=Rhodococcus erythropolis (strain PR4 / NBRC 100887) TaxID=234621 RepID=MSHD_RHOE4|nr:mycothiol synthase [Rhodococcus erythropolis]C0ZP17.1 RecName: Full=Mycothiol acetyltransferase; Short=MSH acetyltransferase; AltName: Full=Mycothiol synthase [Rhodococcus erythropolis PR4]MCW2297085.1 mycothiol synthase [Rhodococcus erythropolis]BAH35513.1 probable acetyltransferase MshD [Rhodococcus erythropolis PR4]
MGWTDSLPAGSAEQVSALLDRATEFDGKAPVSEQGRHAVAGRGAARHFVELDGDTVVGYAQLQAGSDEHPDMAELVVDPQARRRGIGTRLAAAVFDEGRPGTRVWAHGNVDAAVEFAKSLDLVSVRELLQLRRPLDAPQLPEIVVPEGVTMRTYRGPEDDSEILRVNNAAFSWHPEQGGWTQAEIDERTAEGWFDPAGLFMAFADTDPDTLLGFHWTKVHAPEGDDPELGEVYVVGIDPAAQGRGLGRVLTLAGMHYLRDRGLGTVLLYVEGDNTAALHTYERLGFDRFHVDMAYARAL